MSARAIRRLPLRGALESLNQGDGAVVLNSAVSGIRLRFVAKNSEAGPRNFVREIAPRIAFANPVIPINIHRIPDPRSKSKNPNSPDAGAVWENGEQPKPEMTVEFYERPSQTVPLSHLSSTTILQQLLAIAGEDAISAIEAPISTSEELEVSNETEVKAEEAGVEARLGEIEEAEKPI